MDLNVSVSPIDAARLSRQCAEIFDRLKRGSATNSELAATSLKYTARISEIREYMRAIGGDLVAKREKGGVWRYTLQWPATAGQINLFQGDR